MAEQNEKISNPNTGEGAVDGSSARPDEKNFNKTDVIKCPNCGADMYYDIATGKLRCPYCDSTENIDSSVCNTETTLEGFDESKLKRESGTVTYQCPNCHAKTVMHELGTSAKCPFCGATNILKTDDIPGLAPDAILPFKVTKEEASSNSLKWLKKKPYAPIRLKKSFRPENLNSVYSPTFTFDSDTYSSYEGRLGEHYTETVGSGENRKTVTKTRYFNVRGSFSQVFDDVLIEVSPKLNQAEFEKVGAFDTKNAVVYNIDYIAGHASERYDTGINTAFETAKKKMSDRIRAGILAQYKYDVVDYLNVNTQFRKNTFKHLLVPLWCSAFKYRDKIYNYFVNGRSGVVGGKTPVAVWKVALTVLVIVGVLLGIYFGFFYK